MNERRRLLGNGTGIDYLRSYAGYLLISGISNVMGASRFNNRNTRDFAMDFINKNYSLIKKKTHFNDDETEIYLSLDDELLQKYLDLLIEKESSIKSNKLALNFQLFLSNNLYNNQLKNVMNYCLKNELPYTILLLINPYDRNYIYFLSTINKNYKPQFFDLGLEDFKSKLDDMTFITKNFEQSDYERQLVRIEYSQNSNKQTYAYSYDCCSFKNDNFTIDSWVNSTPQPKNNRTLLKDYYQQRSFGNIENATEIEIIETYSPYGFTEESDSINKVFYEPYMNEFENLEYFHEHYHGDMKPIELSVKIDEIDLTLNWNDLKRDIYIPDGTLDNFPTGLYIHRTYYPPMLFLYKDGNECKDITGGYINNEQTLEGGINATKYDGRAINNLTSINIKANNNENDDNAIILFNNKNKLPFREYSFLGIDYSIKGTNYTPEEDAGKYQLTLSNSLDTLKSNIIDINNNINTAIDRNISSFLFSYKWVSDNEEYVDLFNKIMSTSDDLQATYFKNPYKELQNGNIPYMIFKANIFWAWSSERKWSGTVLYLCRGTKDYKYPYLNKKNMKYTFSKIIESSDTSSDFPTNDGNGNKYYIDKTTYGGFYSQDSYDHKGDVLANNDNDAKGYVFFPESCGVVNDRDTPVPISAFELVEVYAPNGIYLNNKLYSHIPFDNLLSIKYLVGKSNLNMTPEIDIHRIYLATMEEGLKQYVFKDGDLWNGNSGGWDNYYTDTHSYWNTADYKGEIIDNEIILDFSDKNMSSEGSLISLATTLKILNLNLYESLSVTYSSTTGTGNIVTSNGCYFSIKLANVLKSSEIVTGGINFGVIPPTSDITKYTTYTKTFSYNSDNGLYVLPMIISERGHKGIVKIKEIYFNKKKIPIEDVRFSKDFPCVITSTTDSITITVKAKSMLNSVLYYKYECIDSSGSTTVLKDYNNSNTYNWMPQISDTYTIKVSVKDIFNNEYFKSSNNLQVHYHPNSVIVFNNGYSNNDLTGGFTKQYIDTHWYWSSSNCGNSKGEIIDNRLVLNHKTFGRYCYIVSLGTTNKIDLSPYSSLCVIYNGKMSSSRKFRIGLATGYSGSELGCVGGTLIPFNDLENNDTGSIVYDVSIGNINEERYILPIILNDSSIYTGQYIKIHSIILIKKNIEIQSFAANVSGTISANTSITFNAIVKRRNAISYSIDAYDDSGTLIENCISGIIGASDLTTSLWGDNTEIGSYTIKNPNNYTFVFTVTDNVTNEKVIKKITGIKVEGVS